MSQLVTSEEKEFEYLRQTEQINDRLCRLEQFVKLDSERKSIEFREIRLWREKVDLRLEQTDMRFDQVDARFEQVDARFDRIDESLKEIREDGKKDRELMKRVLNILETMQADKDNR